ncbi:MAG: gluconokinase [Pseudomonadota bacterium]
MGVSGCGKSSVGQALADRLGVAFIDGDDLHPKSNIDKMSRGEPLTDADRAPWLKLVGMALAEAPEPASIGCSALKRVYRDTIREAAGAPVAFIHLHAEKSVLEERVSQREGHFMPTGLLDSQFDALEMLEADELGRVVSIDQPLENVVAEAQAYLVEGS